MTNMPTLSKKYTAPYLNSEYKIIDLNKDNNFMMNKYVLISYRI